LGFGPPFVGKDTRLDIVRSIADVGYVSCGDICRDEIKRDTKIGRAILAHKKSSGSTLAPTDIILPRIYQEVGVQRKLHRSVILNGFGRQEDQPDPAVEMIAKFGFTSLAALWFKADRELCLHRASKRPPRSHGEDDPEKRFDEYVNISVPAMYKLLDFASQGFPIQVHYYDCHVEKKMARVQARQIKAAFCLPNKKK